MQVSDAYFGTELCRLMDGKYRHLNLQREAPFTAALQLLEARRTGDEKKALDDENGATERILVEYKRSFVSSLLVGFLRFLRLCVAVCYETLILDRNA
jgi:hypothetical protein